MNRFILNDIANGNTVIDLVHDGVTLLSKDGFLHEIRANFTERVYWSTEEDVADVKNEFKSLLSYWWSKRGYHYHRLYDALRLEYSPIENTDKYEEYSDTKIGNDTRSTGTDSTTDLEGTTKVDNITTDDGGTSLSENAYNQSSVVSNVGTQNNTNTVDGTTTVDNVTTLNETTTSTGTNAEILTHSYHAHGNIGITTNVQLLGAEKDLREKLSFIEHDIVVEFVDLYTTW